MKKKKLKTFNDIHKLHQNLMGLLKQDPSNPLGNHKVSLEVRDNNDLLLNIASLLEVCVFALDGNGMLLSPNNQNVTKHDSVCRVLELVLNILPHSQMDFMDYVTEKLNGLNNAKTKSSE
tara:strand:- start:584 stop:943 length:360 start_codon:yes stop_codon:yes gene_type:complete